MAQVLRIALLQHKFRVKNLNLTFRSPSGVKPKIPIACAGMIQVYLLSTDGSTRIFPTKKEEHAFKGTDLPQNAIGSTKQGSSYKKKKDGKFTRKKITETGKYVANILGMQ